MTEGNEKDVTKKSRKYGENKYNNAPASTRMRLLAN